MTAILIKVIIYAAIAGFIYFGVRRLWRDFTAPFRAMQGQAGPFPRRPDLNETARPDVIELKRGPDGVYRPPDSGERR
ncbi:MAG TPA: hypothetical protein VHB74_02820 [Devosia sp.]|nr:hypothetical protein [Devosia sp.]